METCVFCKIVNGSVPSNRVYENEKALAFLDINPVSRGHALVVPKRHFADIFAMPEDDAVAVMHAAKRVAGALVRGMGAKGVNLLNANGKAAGQEVMHFHMHVIPRYENDGIRVWPNSSYKESGFGAVVEKIRNAL